MKTSRQGFSLLELSAVLTIIAVLVTFGINIANSAIKGSDRTTTQERLLAIQKSLDAYVRVNGFYPCPSSRALVPTDSGFGVESRSTTTCTTSGTALVLTGASGAYIGGVPVRTLNLPDTYAADAWGNKITYAVSSLHIGSVGAAYTTDGPLIIRSGDRTGTNYAITTVREEDGSNADGASGVYVLISHGPDGKGAWPMNGTSVTTACGATSNNDVENCDDANVTFYDTQYNDGDQASTFFDDYVLWYSNLLDRTPSTLGGVGTGCTGNCELWCAICDTGYPPMQSPAMICKRSIVSTSPCKALCEYGYPTANVPCP